MTHSSFRLVALALGSLMVFASGCKSDGLYTPDQIVERDQSLCACDSKECVDRITNEIIEHSDKVKAAYPKKEDVPKDVQTADSESRKITMGCMHKLDALSGHRVTTPSAEPRSGTPSATAAK